MATKQVAASHLPEVRERSVRLVLEGGGDHPTQWAAVNPISAKIGCTAETLRKWVRQAERGGGQRPGPTSADRERVKALEREVRELPPPQAPGQCVLHRSTRSRLLAPRRVRAPQPACHLANSRKRHYAP